MVSEAFRLIQTADPSSSHPDFKAVLVFFSLLLCFMLQAKFLSQDQINGMYSFILVFISKISLTNLYLYILYIYVKNGISPKSVSV